MSWGDPDIYYNPEAFGLEIFGTVAFCDDYEHDYFTVWRDANGRFGWGHSSGCSCVGIFEGQGIDDLTWGLPEEVKAGFEDTMSGRSWYTDTEQNKFRLQFVDIFTRMVNV